MSINIGDKRYIISDAAKLIEVESHVLRYWEDELSIEIPRNELGHRYYTDYYIELFKRIKELKDGGFQLKAIKMLLPELMEMNDEDSDDDNIGILKDELFGRLVASGTGNIDREEVSKENIAGESINDKNNDREKADKDDIGRVNIRQENIWQENIRQERIGKDKESNSDADKYTIRKDNIEQGETYAQGGVYASDGNAKSEAGNHTPESIHKDEKVMELREVESTEVATEVSDKNSKLEQFQMIITEVVSNALKENTGALGREVSEIVSDNVIKEMDYLMHLKEKQEEERFKKLDETIRSYQVSSREKSKVNKGIFSILKKL